MADLNYVSPLTSDLTDYYTKTEVDELQQGDENRFATQAQITAGDNEVKGWVASQGYLTQHQSLANYATKEYVDEAIEDIEVESGVKIRVVSNLPANPETNVIYLTRRSSEEDDNVYNEWIYVEDIEDFELIGDTSTGVLPDLTNYATKSYVDGAIDDAFEAFVPPHHADEIDYDNQSSGLLADNVQDAIDEIWDNAVIAPDLATVATSGDYDDLSNKPTIPSLTGYATQTYVNDAVAAIDIPDVSDFITAEDLPDVSDMATETWVSSQGYLTQHQDISGKANAADLATVATSGSYNDLSNKPTIPSTSGLASETYVNNAIAAIDIPTKVSDLDNDMLFVDEPMAKSLAYEEIQNNVSAAGLSGSYDDLDDKPTIPTVPTNVSSFTNDAGYLTAHQDISGKANSADLATVATSGDYDDLTNKPTIPSISGLATETYVDNAVAGISVPANTSDLTNDSGFITSADLPDTSGFVESSDLATVATTGDYDDLTNKPTIPVLPTLATVATSGDYDDLINKPTIPSGGIEGTADGGLAFIYPELLDNSVRKGYVIRSDTPQDELIGWLKSGYWIRLMNSSCQSAIPIGSFGNHNRVFIYTCNVSTGVITSQYYQSGTLSFAGYGWVVRVLPNAFLYIPCSNTSNMDTETLNAIKKMRENYLLNYDNTTSGLTATTIQAAIDELAAASGSSSGITVQDVLDAVANDDFIVGEDTDDTQLTISKDSINSITYDSNGNPTSEIGLDGSSQYIYDTNDGTTTTISSYSEPTGLHFAYSVFNTNRDEETFNKDITIQPTQTMDELQAVFYDSLEGTEDVKTFAFVKDIPDAVEWDYDANTYTLTLSGISQYNDGGL